MEKAKILAEIKKCKNADEIVLLAKSNKHPISKEKACEIFNKIHSTSELSDEELNNVNGGCGSTPLLFNAYDYVEFDKQSDVNYIANEGQDVRFCISHSSGWTIYSGKITSKTALRSADNPNKWYDCYTISYGSGNTISNVKRDIISKG